MDPILKNFLIALLVIAIIIVIVIIVISIFSPPKDQSSSEEQPTDEPASIGSAYVALPSQPVNPTSSVSASSPVAIAQASIAPVPTPEPVLLMQEIIEEPVPVIAPSVPVASISEPVLSVAPVPSPEPVAPVPSSEPVLSIASVPAPEPVAPTPEPVLSVAPVPTPETVAPVIVAPIVEKNDLVKYVFIKREYASPDIYNQVYVINLSSISLFDTNSNLVELSNLSIESKSNFYGQALFAPINLIKNAFDPSANGMFHSSATSSSIDEYVKITLLSPMKLSNISIINRKDCCKNRAIGLFIEVQNSVGEILFKSNTIQLAQDAYTFNL